MLNKKLYFIKKFIYLSKELSEWGKGLILELRRILHMPLHGLHVYIWRLTTRTRLSGIELLQLRVKVRFRQISRDVLLIRGVDSFISKSIQPKVIRLRRSEVFANCPSTGQDKYRALNRWACRVDLFSY